MTVIESGQVEADDNAKPSSNVSCWQKVPLALV